MEEFERRGGGGGGRDPRDGEGPLAGLWKKWAVTLVGGKLRELDSLQQLTPQQVVDRNRLAGEFERVAENADAAWRAVRQHSAVFNNPLVKAVLSV